MAANAEAMSRAGGGAGGAQEVGAILLVTKGLSVTVKMLGEAEVPAALATTDLKITGRMMAGS